MAAADAPASGVQAVVVPVPAVLAGGRSAPAGAGRGARVPGVVPSNVDSVVPSFAERVAIARLGIGRHAPVGGGEEPVLIVGGVPAARGGVGVSVADASGVWSVWRRAVAAQAHDSARPARLAPVFAGEGAPARLPGVSVPQNPVGPAAVVAVLAPTHPVYTWDATLAANRVLVPSP